MRSAKHKVKMPSATSIVARSYPDQIIGIENRLPWRLGSDLRLFRRRTEGHAVIMGRKTFESIGRALPKRENIVLSRTEFDPPDGVRWAKDVSTALLLADIFSICNFKKQFFVIGGEIIYDVFKDYINKVYLTEVFTRVNGDAKFTWDFPREKWRYYKEVEFSKSDIDQHPFRVTTLVRLKPMHRYESVDRLLRADPETSAFLDNYEAMIEASEPHTVEEEQLALF